MTRVVLDASAWFHYLEGTPSGAKVKGLLADARTTTVITPAIVVAEVLGKMLRGRRNPQPFLQAVASSSEVEPLSQSIAEHAARIYGTLKPARPGLSLADAIVLAHAQLGSATCWTTDSDIADQPGAVTINP